MSLCNGGNWYISSTSVNVGKQLIQFYIVCYLTVENFLKMQLKNNWVNPKDYVPGKVDHSRSSQK